MKSFQRRLGVPASVLCMMLVMCTTPAEQVTTVVDENRKFLESEKGHGELFRVLFTSDEYIVKQTGSLDSIVRTTDAGGDTYMCNEIKKHDKFHEVRESVLTVWLYPDSGSLMKIRPKEPTFLIEIDRILLEDLQRWTFKFPRKFVSPTKFDVRYRIVLRKTLSDEEIMEELREKLKEKSSF